MIAYTHKTHPRSKSIKIRINQNKEVVVTSPWFIPKFKINAFIKQSEPWIKEQLLKIRQRKTFGETQTELMVFGKKYQKMIDLGSSRPIGVHLEETQIIINPIEDTLSKISGEVTRFLKSTAERYILPRTKQLADKMGLSFKRVTLRQQKTRWGSCSSQGNLNFNWRLVHCSPKIIDYVIIHELAHLEHMDHSTGFWNLVKKYDPDYLQHRGWLKRNGLTLG